jgi:hypothetical protein
MSVRAKFQVTRIESQVYSTNVKREDGSGYDAVKREMRTIVMHPVYSNDPTDENRRFWDASPSGELRLGTVNPDAWAQFDLDGVYYLDFTKAPNPADSEKAV